MKPENFGINLRQLLHELGMSQAELAERSKITPAAISQYISGEREPSLSSVCKILIAIPVKFERLVR